MSRAEVRNGFDWQAVARTYRMIEDVELVSATDPTAPEHKLGYLEAALTAGLARRAEGVPLGFRFGEHEVRIAADDVSAWRQFPVRRVDGAHMCRTAIARSVQTALRQ
jgi:hypothetical protein